MNDLKLQAERYGVCVRNIQLSENEYFCPYELESMNTEAMKRREEEEEVLEFVRTMGIPEDLFKKTKDSAY
jgi:adenylate cyclase class IV